MFNLFNKKIKRSHKTKKDRLNSNKSKKIPNGTLLRTRDDYFASGKNYQKPDYEKKGNYRQAIVIDSNRKNELITTKKTHSKKNGKKIAGIRVSKRIETKDNYGKPITLGAKFIPDRKKGISPSKAKKIKKTLTTKVRKEIKISNNKKIAAVKKRGK